LKRTRAQILSRIAGEFAPKQKAKARRAGAMRIYPHMMRAVIFDVDGTLVDSVDLHARAWQETFQHFGKEFTFAKVRTQIGKGGDQLLPVFLSEGEIEARGEEIAEYRKHYFQKRYLPQVQGFPKVRELFLFLQSQGHELALASSAIGEELEAYKKAAGIADLSLGAETSKDDAEKSKPHPDIFQAALAQLGHPSPSDAMVIGDTPYDIEAASRAGLRTIAVRCGGFPEETLQGAAAIFDGPADLLARYSESPLARS
jgi:phosphoglycolate phosphatase-like HAD superfamily hydrolase